MEQSLAERLAEQIRKGDRESMLRASERWAPSGNHRMSGWGHPCARHLWYERRFTLDAKDRNETFGASMWLGRVLEDPIADRVKQALGADAELLHLDQTVTIEEPALTHPITGKLDRIARVGVARMAVEIKRVGGGLFKEIDDGPDGWIKQWESKHFWFRTHVAQVIGYTRALVKLHGDAFADDSGLLVYVSSGPENAGAMKVLVVPCDEMVYTECLCNAILAELDDIDEDPGGGGRIDFGKTCQMCDWRHKCLQTIEGETLDIVSDPEMLDLLNEWRRLKGYMEYAKQFEQVDEAVKGKARRAGTGRFVTSNGAFVVTVKPPVDRKVYEIPDDVKATYLTGTKPDRARVNIECVDEEVKE
jgi:hypothetical protein